jgi:tellurite resistance protein TerA
MGIDYTKREPEQAPAGDASAGGKVVLTKRAPSVSLTKKGAPGGMLRVNLNWTARPPGAAPTGGFLKRLTAPAQSSIDLDLGCLYEFTDGSKGVVQALGNAFRSRSTLTDEAVIWLDGDDRSGASSGGENLFVNLAHTATIKRVLVFASIYEGALNWAAADGVVTLFPASGPEVEIRLDEADSRSPMCAIALLENTGGELHVRREVRYVQGAQDALDRAYSWGMNWTPGRK